jgi:hypothetical protein
MTETAGNQFFQKVLPECNAPPASSYCAFSSVWGKFRTRHDADVEFDANGHKVF